MTLRDYVFLKVIIVLGIAMLLGCDLLLAQESPLATKEAQDAQQFAQKYGEIQRLAYDPKLAEELELAPDQKKKILIALQKHQDAMMKRARPKPGETPDMNAYQQTMKDLMNEVDGVLSEKQTAKLADLAKQRLQAPRPEYSREKMEEMQKLSGIMQELNRLSFDAKLAEELELTPEQRVDIREAQQSLQQAMQERSKAGTGQAFDTNAYTEMMGNLVMEAQDILTTEQSQKLTRIVKLKGLKQKFGDEFAMIMGLAEEFQLDEAKTKALSEKIAEVREDYYDEWLDLKKESMEKIIRELPQKHREEVDAAVKEFVEEDPRSKQRPFFQ
jgi:hypothetical protein